jgi:hypothetical protein
MGFSFDEEREIEKFIKYEISEYFENFDDEMEKSDEIGHSHGPGVQKKVGSILEKKYSVVYETDKKGKKKKRAFSDIILNDIPINVKFTVKENGQPNLTSGNRMVKHVLDGKNYDYMVLTVYYNTINKEISVKFVNILQFLECVNYDNGTGQMMISQDKFNKQYNKFIDGEKIKKEFYQIREELINLKLKKSEQHIKLKEKELEKFKNKYL